MLSTAKRSWYYRLTNLCICKKLPEYLEIYVDDSKCRLFTKRQLRSFKMKKNYPICQKIDLIVERVFDDTYE